MLKLANFEVQREADDSFVTPVHPRWSQINFFQHTLRAKAKGLVAVSFLEKKWKHSVSAKKRLFSSSFQVTNFGTACIVKLMWGTIMKNCVCRHTAVQIMGLGFKQKKHLAADGIKFSRPFVSL